MERIKEENKYCLSIGNQDFKTVISEIKKYKIAEIRLDLCNFSIEQTEILFSSHNNLIATFRKNNNYSESKRIDYLKKAIMSGAGWIDLDFKYDSKSFKNEIINYARSHNVKIIISVHDYEKTPETVTIKSIIKKIRKLSPDLIKLAFFAQSQDDNDRVIELYKGNLPILAFNMGEKGKITRVKSLLYGAPFAYVRSEIDQTAAGQMTLEEMMQYPQ